MRRQFILLSIMILMLLFSSCKQVEENRDDGNVIDIYYMDNKGAGLVSNSYLLISIEIDEQINEILYMLKNNPDNISYKSVLPREIKTEFSLENDGGLTLNFSTEYSDLTDLNEILCRAAIVKTLCQLPQVDYIQINVNGSPLIDSNEEVVGPMDAKDFVDDTQTNMNYKVKLYFANEEGNALVEYNTQIEYTVNDTIEELVIQSLIDGPDVYSRYQTIPGGTKLLDIYRNGETCYVDFNDNFLKKLPGVTNEVAIYSVVNTLVELPSINKVEFRVEGAVVKTFMDSVEFDIPFERNLDLIEKEK